jgi:hypothetical protein
MKLTKWLLTAGCALALGVPHAWTQAPAPANPPAVPDMSKKKVVERPTTKVVANSAPVQPAPAVALDLSKTTRIEPSVSKLVAATAPTNTTTIPDANPTVEPGKVKWHKTLADAQAASEKTGRPVLLFHMMGQLDKQFC